jgi:hypothetical protein
MTPRQPCDHFEPGANLARCSKCGWAKGKHRARKQPKCATTGLFRYATPEAARVAVNRLLGKPNSPMDTVRQLAPRPCPHCHGVHLRLEGEDDVATSQPSWEARP